MTNQDPKQHWQQQSAERRAKLDSIRRDLRLATERFKQSGAAVDGSNVASLAGAERLAEIALDGAKEQLKTADIVRFTQPRSQLLADRARIVRAMEYRHREREQQIDLERQRCGRMPERHIETHLRNVFGRFDYRECMGDAEDKKALARIDSELATFDHEAAAPLGAA